MAATISSIDTWHPLTFSASQVAIRPRPDHVPPVFGSRYFTRRLEERGLSSTWTASSPFSGLFTRVLIGLCGRSTVRLLNRDEPSINCFFGHLAAYRESRPTLGRDDPTTDAVVDTLTEEELLRGLERLVARGAVIKKRRWPTWATRVLN